MFESSMSRRKFQKGLDCDKARALRRDSELSLRRKQREEHLQKRRKRLTTNKNTNNGNKGGEGTQESLPLISEIPKYVGMIFNTSSIEIQLKGTRSIRKLLSIERDPPTVRIVRSGVIPKIISFMYGNGNGNNELIQELQFESAWILTNIAASSTQLVHQIVQNNVIEAFVYLFRHTDVPDIADQAIWGLGNIAGDNKTFRDRILNTGFLNDCVKNIFDLKEDMQQNIVWTISNLFRYKDPLQIGDVHEICGVLCKLLRDSRHNDAIIADCLWAFHYISNNPNNSIINYLFTLFYL